MKTQERFFFLKLALAAGLALGATTASAIPTVSLTFDDGLVTDTTAQQLLDAHGMKGTFYVSSGLFDEAPGYYLDLPHMLGIQAAGHEIGDHTISHFNLAPESGAQPSVAEQQHEICDSRAQMLSLGFTPVVSFAYPFGDATTTTQGLVQACGYTSGRGAWNSDPVTNGDDSDTEILPVSTDTGGDPYWIRTPDAVVKTTTLADLESYVTEAENVPGGVGWVVLQLHFVCADSDSSCNSDDYSVKTSIFTPFLDWLQGQVSAGAVAVKPVGEVMGGFHTTPTPAIFNLIPSVAAPGGSAFTLTVNGVNFVDGSTVLWNGSARTTVFVGSTTLTAQIPASDLAVPQPVTVTVANPLPDVSTSPGMGFTIGNPVPALTALSSTFTLVGSSLFTLTATGSNFTSGSTVLWNGSARTTTFVSATTLNAAIPAADLAAVGIDSVTVFTAAPGGGTSTVRTFTVANPAPALTALSSTFTAAGSPAFTLTLTGANFVPDSVVRWNGAAISTTTFVNSTTLQTQVPSGSLALAGISSVTVFNAAPGGGTSSNQAFTVFNPVPGLTALSSTFTVAGSLAFTLTLSGSNFVPGSIVRWNGAAMGSPTFINSTTLQTQISSGALTTAGISSVTVFNAAPGGGTSSIQTFNVENPVPALTALSSTFTLLGSSTFTLTLTGSNFVPGSAVRWNGAAVSTTTFVNSTTLRTQVPSGALASAGISSVTVFNAAPGGGASSPRPFAVGYPVPVLAALASTSAVVGSSSFTLTVTGSGFAAVSTVRWNGADRSTTFVTGSTLTAQVLAGDLAATGSSAVTVFTPGPGGGGSAGKTFTVINPVPAVTALSSTAAVVGSPAFTLTVTGTNFVAGSVVQWNGSPRATTFVSSSSLKASITAVDLSSVCFNTVAVVNPAPGGGSSSAQTYLVGNPDPVLVSLSSSSAIVGSPAFTLTVTGSRFLPGSVVNWNGSARATSFADNTALTAHISTGDLASVGTASITVVNPAPGGGTSGIRSFTVGYPAPVLEAVSPRLVHAGGAAFTLTATGRNFYGFSSLKWNDLPVSISSFTATTLTALIPASYIQLPGEVSITVFTPLPGGGSSSLPDSVGIAAGGDGSPGCNMPTATSLEPPSVPAGSADFTLTVRGANFFRGSTIMWNGSPKPTTFVNSRTLTAPIAASAVRSGGLARVTVFTAGPGGGASTELAIPVGANQGRVYPNPWNAALHSRHLLMFDELPAGSTVKIFTISGHWVKTLHAQPGYVGWDLKAEGGSAVASGYYLYLVTSPKDSQSRGVFGIIR